MALLGHFLGAHRVPLSSPMDVPVMGEQLAKRANYISHVNTYYI